MIGNLLAKARAVSALEYLKAVETSGRAHLSEEMRRDLSNFYMLADALHIDVRHQRTEDRELIGFLTHALSGEHFLWENGKPRYVAYANMRLLDDYLYANEQTPAQQKWFQAKRAIAIILKEWLDFEDGRLVSHQNRKLPPTIIGFETQEKKIDHLQERVFALTALFDSLPVHDVPDTRIIRSSLVKYGSDWHYFAANPDLQVAHFTCLPQSMWHDEVMFLRMIHLTECSFSGILASLEAVPVAVLHQEWLAAAELIKESLFFADFLIRAWAVFETMPTDHFFHGFREATGDSSAIQSLRFQKLDVLTRGLSDAKKTALSHQREAAPYATWAPPDEAALPAAVMLAQAAATAEAAEFVAAAEALDRDLHKWRARHLGIARKYLPRDAVGTGNEGIGYLEATYRAPRLLKTDAEGANTDHPVLDEGISNTGELMCPARASATYRLHSEAPPLALVEGSDFTTVDLTAVIAALYEQVGALAGRDATRHHEMYQEFFRGHTFPLARQWSSYERSRRIPSKEAPALLLSAEFRSGLLMGLHHAGKISGTLVADIARNESFVGLGGEAISCSMGEFVLRDSKGILASFFQGPDQRTAVHLANGKIPDKLYLVIIGYPNLASSDLYQGMQVAADTLGALGAQTIREWVIYER
jgi:tryptophan 2,3-dioxygenase